MAHDGLATPVELNAETEQDESMQIVQVDLSRGSSRLTCWLEAGRIKSGNQVRLKGIEGWWNVDRVYLGLRQESEALKSDWKVGGLKERSHRRRSDTR